MKVSTACMLCLLGKQQAVIDKCADEEKREIYLKQAFLRIGQATEEDSAPVLYADLHGMAKEAFGEIKSYQKEKEHFNQLMLKVLPEVEKKIRVSDEPIKAAVKYARAGNYIDFGAMPDVKEDKLMEILDQATEEELTEEVYVEFLKDLEWAKSLVYVTDNCGEVVMDMAFIKLLKEKYPNLSITALVRGQEAINDATIEDASFIGLTEIVPVIGNGSDVPGTALHRINQEAEQLLKGADIVIAKGQGNLETLYSSNWGLNIYYLFLCKCDYFTKKFGVKKYTGVFMREVQEK